MLATIGPSQSAPSAMAYGITLPLAPTGLGVTYLNGGVATFTWTDASLLAAGCSIDQLMPGGTWRQIQTNRTRRNRRRRRRATLPHRPRTLSACGPM